MRRIVGYRRLKGPAAAQELASLYAQTRLFVNVFQPSFKLAEKERGGAWVRKRYHASVTPCDRLLPSPVRPARCSAGSRFFALDPVQFLSKFLHRQQAFVLLTENALALPLDTSTALAPAVDFLTGSRTAWQMGEIRPTTQPSPKTKRGHRRPDPLIVVTDNPRSRFEADPSQTGRQLHLRLQESDPDRYPDALLRTVPRRFRTLRSEVTAQLVFGMPKQQPAAATLGTNA